MLDNAIAACDAARGKGCKVAHARLRRHARKMRTLVPPLRARDLRAQLMNALARAQIMMTPITFKEDASDNPNKGLGILKGCGLARIL